MDLPVDQQRSPIESLTPREQEVLALILAGRTNRRIGEALGISVRTVEVHRLHIMAKLKASNVVELCFRCRDWRPTNVPGQHVRT